MAERNIVTRMKLEYPIKWNNQELTELEFVNPTIKMIRTNGYPFHSGKNGEPEADNDSVAGFMADMSGLPIQAIDLMSLQDYVQFVSILSNFFIVRG